MRVVLFLTALALFQQQEAHADALPAIPVKALFANPKFSYPDLSDNGSHLAYVQSMGDLQVVIAEPIGGGKPIALAKFDHRQTRPNQLEWANDQRILISAHARDPDSIGMRSRQTRLFGVNKDGSNFSWLGRDWPTYGSRQRQAGRQDSLVHLTPDDPQTILISYWSPKEESPQVMKLDVSSGHLTVAEKRRKDISAWYADSSGAIRAGSGIDGNMYQLWARIDAAQDFDLMTEYDRLDLDGLRFAGFHADPRKLYVSRLHEGRRAIFEFDIASRASGQLVAAHSEFDVSAVELSGSTRTAVGAIFTGDRRRIHYFTDRMDGEFSQLADTLAHELGRVVDVEPVSESVDGMMQVLSVSSDRQPPLYYLYDRSVRRIQKLFDPYPEIPVESLAPTRRVTFQARDGLSIPAYLTLPPGIDPRDLPAVLLVHGGPQSRDRIQWDPEVQLLAGRGFAVLQVNFRGSSGFGKAFRDAGNREWGQKMQDDLTDGVRWLVAQGTADPDRIGIMGTSYGGFAALIGLVKTPELYRAGIAYAAVTDIEATLADHRWYGSSEELDRMLIGGEVGDSERLRSSSPLRRAGEIVAPVLLGHGVDDPIVHVRQSQAMADALRSAGRRVDYLEFADEVHGFALEANRFRWYARVADFLVENLAPRPAAAP